MPKISSNHSQNEKRGKNAFRSLTLHEASKWVDPIVNITAPEWLLL